MLSMGTILNIKDFRSHYASFVYPVRNSNSPYIIQEAAVSPGCTLADSTTPFLPSESIPFFSEIIKESHRLPAKVLPIGFIFKNFYQCSSICKSCKYS